MRAPDRSWSVAGHVRVHAHICICACIYVRTRACIDRYLHGECACMCTYDVHHELARCTYIRLIILEQCSYAFYCTYTCVSSGPACTCRPIYMYVQSFRTSVDDAVLYIIALKCKKSTKTKTLQRGLYCSGSKSSPEYASAAPPPALALPLSSPLPSNSSE